MGIRVAYDRRRRGIPLVERSPGTTTRTNRRLLETNQANIVYANFQTGNDGNTGDFGDPLKTYSAAVTKVGATSKTHIEWETDDLIADNITVPTQTKQGIEGQLASVAFNGWTNATENYNSGATAYALSSDDNGNWVAGSDGGGSSAYIQISSDDGQTWSNPTDETAIASTIVAIENDRAGNWVAMDNLGNVYLSSDNGDNWAAATDDSALSFSDLRAGIATDRSGRWVACGGNTIAYSTDNGDNWTAATSKPTTYTSLRDVETDTAGVWIIVNNTTSIIKSTDGGDNWSNVSTSPSQSMHNVTTNRAGVWMCCSEFSSSYYRSTDDGDTWSAISGTFASRCIHMNGEVVIASQISGGTVKYSVDGGLTFLSSTSSATSFWELRANETSGAWVGVGIGTNQIQYTSAISIDANLSGFDMLGGTFKLTTASVLLRNCQAITNPKAIVSTVAGLQFDECWFESVEDNALDITSDTVKVLNTLCKTGGGSTKRAIYIDGTASTDYDIDVEFCTIVGTIEFENTGSTGLERLQNSILTSSATATVAMIIESGTIFGGGTLTNFTLGARASQTDPLFLTDGTYRLQRESGYNNNDTTSFDSPLLNTGYDHTGATVDHLTDANSLVRDPGAWSHDDGSVSLQFTKAWTFPDPVNENDIKEKTTPKAFFYKGDTGEADVANDPLRRVEGLTINWETLKQEDINVIQYIEDLDDTTIFLSLFPEEAQISMPTVIVDGAQSAGVFSVKISEANTFAASMYQIAGKDYWAMYVYPSATAATDIVLDRPLEDALSDLDQITVLNPAGIGIYKLLPQEREHGRKVKEEVEYKTGTTIQLIEV